MGYEEYIKLGLDGEEPLKLILRGCVEVKENAKVGVVSVVYATTDKELAEQKIKALIENQEGSDYYMVYSVPLNTDLTTLNHYPSIAIEKNDLV